MNGTCDTCGATDTELFVYALPGIPWTVGNCRVCFEVGAYPWELLVANTAQVWAGEDDAMADWWKDAIVRSLARHGKTFEEFFTAVEQVHAEVDAAMKAAEAVEAGRT